jgi:hypothetical protein
LLSSFDVFWAGLHAAEAWEAINSGVDLLAKTTMKLMGEAKGRKPSLASSDSTQVGGDGRAGA